MVSYSIILEIKKKIKDYKEAVKRLKRHKETFAKRHSIRMFEIVIAEYQAYIINWEIEKLKQEGKDYVLKKTSKRLQKVSKK